MHYHDVKKVSFHKKQSAQQTRRKNYVLPLIIFLSFLINVFLLQILQVFFFFCAGGKINNPELKENVKVFFSFLLLLDITVFFCTGKKIYNPELKQNVQLEERRRSIDLVL